MCGIFGYFDRAGSGLQDAIVYSMGEAIRHRGPDDSGVNFGNYWALGNQRLSIIDIEGGRQPFVSEDGRFTVVQNGEIFNYIELAKDVAHRGNPCKTQSDTEVLLRLYQLEGINFLRKLNGMFSIGIYDSVQDALFLARDRVGVKPLYYHDDGKRIIFSSEIKSILQLESARRETDIESLHHYLTFNYVPPPYTMYRGIRHVMPGHYMKITRSQTFVRQWWDLATIEPVFGRSEDEWVAEFNEILDDAVKIRLRSDAPFGAFLSGGVDSSSIVGLMARHMDSPVKTFCIGFDDPRYDESQFAQEASNRFGTHHTMKKVNPDMLDLWPKAIYHCDQPHGDISFLPTYKVSELAAKDVKMVLTGDGGDELFAGYDKYRRFFMSDENVNLSDEDFQRSYFSSISLFSDASKESIYKEKTKKATLNISSFDIAGEYFSRVKHQDRLNQALYLDMQLLLSGNNLVKPDRMGMAVSLEARTPFLDYRMMELAFRMPGALKIKNNETKYIYKKAVAPLIGKQLSYRKKQMFTVPVGDWFRTNKADYCRQQLAYFHENDSAFDHKVVDDVFNQHLVGNKNMTRELRALVAFSIWDKNK